jgi:hypothetical protein
MPIYLTDIEELNAEQVEQLEAAQQEHLDSVEFFVQQENNFWLTEDTEKTDSVGKLPEDFEPPPALINFPWPQPGGVTKWPPVIAYIPELFPRQIVQIAQYMSPPFDGQTIRHNKDGGIWKVITKSPCTIKKCDGRFETDVLGGIMRAEALAEGNSKKPHDSSGLTVTFKKVIAVSPSLANVPHVAVLTPDIGAIYKWNLSGNASCSGGVYAYMAIKEVYLGGQEKWITGSPGLSVAIDNFQRSQNSPTPTGTDTRVLNTYKPGPALPRIRFTPNAGASYYFFFTLTTSSNCYGAGSRLSVFAEVNFRGILL